MESGWLSNVLVTSGIVEFEMAAITCKWINRKGYMGLEFFELMICYKKNKSIPTPLYKVEVYNVAVVMTVDPYN